MTGTSNEEIKTRIDRAVASGVDLSEKDRAEIVSMADEAEALLCKLSRMRGADDPLRKGNAFPMGVGFTRVTKRAEQRLDASVRRAGELVSIARRAEAIRTKVEARLSGIGTEAGLRRKQEGLQRGQKRLVEILLDVSGSTRVGEFVITKVNFSRDGLPISYNFTGAGITKGVNDKIDVVRVAFAGDRAQLARVVATVIGEARLVGDGARLKRGDSVQQGEQPASECGPLDEACRPPRIDT